MRNLLLALGSALTIPIAILNWGAVIVGGIWLAILGQWPLLVLGLFLIFGGWWLLALFMSPGVGIGYLAARVFEKSKLAASPLIALTAIYNFVVLCAWCVGLFYFCELRMSGPYWPFILWAYALATIPWVQLHTKENERRDAEEGIIWVAGAEFGSVAVMASVIVGYGFQTEFGMIVFFVPIALLGMGVTAVATHYKRTRTDRIFAKIQREEAQKRAS